MDLDNYIEQLNNIKKELIIANDICKNIKLKSCSDRINNCINTISNDRFNLVVVGNFSRGKSTFVDALMGRKILPVSKKPTTAIISKITYSDIPRFIIHYKEQEPKEISEEIFYGITAPKGMDENDPKDVREKLEQQAGLDKIDYAEIGYPLSFCHNGVDLVDTPGTNDMSSIRVDITYKYLNCADAVIMVLAATQALTANELEFLKERILKEQIEDIFFVVNFKDELKSPESEKEVIDYLKEKLMQVLPKKMKNKIKIYLISSYQALLFRRKMNGEELSAKMLMKVPNDFSVTGFNEFESALGKFLSEEKGKIRLNKYSRISQIIINDIIQMLNKRIEISKHSADDIRNKYSSLQPEFNRTRNLAKKIIDDMEISLDSHHVEIINMCSEASGEILKAAREAVDNYSGRIKANEMKNCINNAVNNAQKKFIERMTSYQQKVLQSEYNKVNDKIARIWNQLDNTYGENFNISTALSSNNFSLNITNEKGLSDDQVNWGVGLSGGALGAALVVGLFPALILGSLAAWCFGLFDNTNQKIKNEIKHQINQKMPVMSENIQKNVVNAYDNQVEKLKDSISQNINKKIDDMEYQLKLVIQEKEAKENQEKRQLEYLNNMKERAMLISNKIQEIVK